MDAYKRGDEFFVHLDLPGVNPDSIEITVESGVLTVRADRAFDQREGDQVIVSERPQGTFTRELRLGRTVDTDNIAASYEDGVLTLTLPVAAEAKPRRVEVKPGGGGQRTIES